MKEFNKIKFFFPFRTSLAERTRLKIFLVRLLRKEGRTLAGLNVVFCSDRELLRINKEYLGHDYFTDIITFDLSEKGQPLVAEIHISVERVRENAMQLGVSFKEELHRVIFHGVLHLCGYGDKSEKLSRRMREKENLYLNKYFK
jgi:rRNA maturation RNase YbeY